MSTSFNGTSPQGPVRVATVSREQTPAEVVARQSHSDRPPVREEEARPWIDHQAVRAHEWWSHRVLE